MTEQVNVYDAILNAAAFIEATPERFNFMECTIPRANDCGTPGCALGWIGAMAGLADPDEQFGGIAIVAGHHRNEEHPPERSLLGIDQLDFYERMDALVPHWAKEASACAKGLRLYAEQYHGDEKPEPRNFAREMYLQASGPVAIKESAVSEELTW